jgi:cytochrome c551
MSLPRPLLAVLAALVLGLAACGGDDGGDSGGGGGGGDGGGATQSASSPEERFANTCGNCHTLSAAGTEGQVGPNLDDVKPSKDQVLQAIQEGPSVMPENLLQGAEADAVAQYVADSAGS